MAKKSKKRFFSFFRWLHIYCSTALFTLLIFFAITGITLNHRWYDSDSNTEHYLEIEMDETLTEALSFSDDEGMWKPDLTSVIEILRTEHQLKDSSSIDIDSDMREIVVEFRAPASFASAILNLEEGILILEKESGSTLGILNDLHKGRHSGAVWRWLIDISAVLMVIFSISGLVLLYHGKKHRRAGTLVVLLGTLSPIIIYMIAAPRI